ncbi:transcriptional regulator BetI [Marinomonas sp.]|nr:transcriptional regulator BetI [Marinomonas sp.]MDB4837225.1 transcriptional regulator BetI [Marinomonas sp.]
MPKVGMAAIRKPQLIDATMQAIQTVGLRKANVAIISQYAGVTPAIINHYFGGKDGLLDATMRFIINELANSVRLHLAKVSKHDVEGRIHAIVEGNFAPLQLEPKVIKTWLTFCAQAMHEPILYRLQRVNEQRLLSYLRLELKRVMPHEKAVGVAQTLAALIYGFWLRGALSSTGINREQVLHIINDYLKQQLATTENTV